MKNLNIELYDNTLSYYYLGNKKSKNLILGLHGLGCSRKVFQYIEKSKLVDDFQIVIPDLIGFGSSIANISFDFSIRNQAKVVEAFLEQFKYDNLIIIAHSMGNAVALLLDDKVLSKTKQFFNLEGNLIADDCRMFSQPIVEIGEIKYKNEIFPQHKAELEGHPELDFNRINAETMFYSSKSLVETSVTGKLLKKFQDLKIEKYYLWGEENKSMKILTVLDDDIKIMIPKCGHGMLTEQPEIVYNFIYDKLINQI